LHHRRARWSRGGDRGGHSLWWRLLGNFDTGATASARKVPCRRTRRPPPLARYSALDAPSAAVAARGIGASWGSQVDPGVASRHGGQAATSAKKPGGLSTATRKMPGCGLACCEDVQVWLKRAPVQHDFRSGSLVADLSWRWAQAHQLV